jgi:type IV pilus assembly protein PilX
MHMNHRAVLVNQRQRGAIMVVSLLLLLVMTVLALTASQTTTLQERMAGNARDSDLAFQSAEAGLRDAEAVTTAISKRDSKAQTCTLTDSCEVKLRDINYTPDFARGEDFWKDNPRQYADAGKQIGEVVSDPQIYTELRATVPDTLTVSKPNSPAGTGIAYYTHTVRAKGGTDTATIVLQTVSAERYPR